MPIHDWTRVRAGTFHHFHLTWISRICSRLNNGVLPPGYEAFAEQSTGKPIPDLLSLEIEQPSGEPPRGGIALAEHPPKVVQHQRDRSGRRAGHVASVYAGGRLRRHG